MDPKDKNIEQLITDAAASAAAAVQKNNDAVVVANAVVSKDIEYIKKDIGEIKVAIKEMGSQFVTRPEHLEIIKLISDIETRNKSFQDDVEKRLRVIEQNLWKFIGMMIVISAVVGLIEGFALKLIK